jgi:hypothetical protein
MNTTWSRCCSCGATLGPSLSLLKRRTLAAAAAIEGVRCPSCAAARSSGTARPSRDACPRCDATRVLRTTDGSSRNVLFCPHCDNVWSPVESLLAAD